MNHIRMRELLMYAESGSQLRYDFAYRDPASGRVAQIGVGALLLDGDPVVRDERIVPHARAVIERCLRRKCGVKLAIENQIHLELPVFGVGRYV